MLKTYSGARTVHQQANSRAILRTPRLPASNSRRRKLHTTRNTASHPITLCHHKPHHIAPVVMDMPQALVGTRSHMEDSHHLSTTVVPDPHINLNLSITTHKHNLTHTHHKAAISMGTSTERYELDACGTRVVKCAGSSEHNNRPM